MKIMMIVITLFLNLYSSDYKNISLLDYAEEVAHANNINIFIDEDIEKDKISFFVPTLKRPVDLFKSFNLSILKKDLILKKELNFYFLTKQDIIKPLTYLYQLKNNTYEDINLILTNFKIETKHLKHSNKIAFTCTPKIYKKILPLIEKIDLLAKQVTLKFTIFEFRDNEADERGIEFATIYKDASNILQVALNTILLPMTSSTGILNATSFYGALKLLQKANKVHIKQFPFVLAQHNKKFNFEAVENIPYLISQVSTSAQNVENQTNVDYKDVGLKIIGTSQIFEKFVNLDLELTIDNVIDNGNKDTPSTFKRSLSSTTTLNYNEVLLLSGIVQDKKEHSSISIPFISNIPYLGEIFKYNYITKDTAHITIAIEVIKNTIEDKGFHPLKSLCEPANKTFKGVAQRNPLGYL